MSVCRYRNIPVGVADQGLPADAIALYLAVYTSSEMNLCGVLFSSRDRLADMAGIRSSIPGGRLRRLDRAITDLGMMVQWWPDLNVMFIPGFAMLQAANPNIWVGAMKNASNLPKQVAGIVQQSIMRDFTDSVDESKPYYGQTLEKLRKATVAGTVSEPLPEPFRTIPGTHARVTRLPERAPARPRMTEGSEGADLSLSVHTPGAQERERGVMG